MPIADSSKETNMFMISRKLLQAAKKNKQKNNVKHTKLISLSEHRAAKRVGFMFHKIYQINYT